MADTAVAKATERKRRSRAHKRGDHALCLDPDRCRLVERALLADEPVQTDRGPRAQALWDQMNAPELGPIERVLLEEACRVVDRLDLLRKATDVTALTEARHQATALRGLLSQIQKATGASTKPGAGSSAKRPAPQPRKEGDLVVVDLASSLAARRAASAG